MSTTKIEMEQHGAIWAVAATSGPWAGLITHGTTPGKALGNLGLLLDRAEAKP